MNSPRRFACLAVTLVLLPLVGTRAGADPAGKAADAGPAGPKTHALFMGTDISVEHGTQLYRVQDVSGSSFVITVDEKPVLVPMQGGVRNLKVEHSLKLTPSAVSVTGLSGERAFTPGSDPRTKRQIATMRMNAAVGDNASLAMGKYIVAQNKFGSAINPDENGYTKISSDALNAAAAAASIKAFEAERLADAQMSTDITSGAFASLQAGRDMAQDIYDAVEVEFTVSSQTPLTTPYLVLIVRYREKEGKPDAARNMIYARALDPIGSKPEKVHILKGGLPPGYILENYQVHLYDLGREVATDVAPSRVALTREDAFQYLKADYLSRHKGDTLPAFPALGMLDAEAKARLSSVQLSRRYFVKVSNDGQPVAAFADEACSEPVDAVVEAQIEQIRFYPALEKGRRVDGVARLLFANLTL